MMHKEEMKESGMKGMMCWCDDLSEDKKKAFIKAKLDWKMKKVQANM